jgi:hypothetical protein
LETSGLGLFQNFFKQKAEETSAAASISFSVVGKTALEANASISAIAPCPKTTSAAISVKNSGSNDAERLFVEPSQNLVIQKCIGCDAKTIKSNESILLSLGLCKKNPLPQSLRIYSLNADAIEVKIV